MADREPAYDPWPAGGSAEDRHQAKIDRINKDMDAAKAEMQRNIEATTKRSANLDTLQDKTDHLQAQSQGFRKGANRVRKQMWWKDMKMRICIIVGIIILLIVIIVPSVVASRHS